MPNGQVIKRGKGVTQNEAYAMCEVNYTFNRNTSKSATNALLHKVAKTVEESGKLRMSIPTSPPPGHEGTWKKATKMEKMEVSLRILNQAVKHNPPKIYFPIPRILEKPEFTTEKGGKITMSFIPGAPLKKSWAGLRNQKKADVCAETWNLITNLRKMPQPKNLKAFHMCDTLGCELNNVLIQDHHNLPPLLHTSHDLRTRIANTYRDRDRYAEFSRDEMVDMLPKAGKVVFTHGDICPENIMVDDETGKITGLLSWGKAGWCPEWWEFCCMVDPGRREWDWVYWMERCAPRGENKRRMSFSAVNIVRRWVNDDHEDPRARPGGFGGF